MTYASKEVLALPDPLEANTIYYIRTGDNLRAYYVGAAGTVTHERNVASVEEMFGSAVVAGDPPVINVGGGGLTAQQALDLENWVLYASVNTLLNPPNNPYAVYQGGPASQILVNTEGVYFVYVRGSTIELASELDWGDGSATQPLTQPPGGWAAQPAHTYTATGTYTLKVRSTNRFGSLPWTDALTVTIIEQTPI